MTTAFNPIPTLANELSIPAKIVSAVVEMLNEGNTIPFIARYRKERTDGLDEVQIRDIQEKLAYVKEMHERRQTILTSIESQGKLTDLLKEQILGCKSKTELEDLYLPYKPKRRTKAMIAKEKGLEPLSLIILSQPLEKITLESIAAPFIDSEKGVNTTEEAFAGARDIVAEILSERADVRALVREVFINDGFVVSKVSSGKENEISKFQDYYDYREKANRIPSHRYLAIRRGENEGILNFHIEVDVPSIIGSMQKMTLLQPQSVLAKQLEMAIADSYKRLISPSVETEQRIDLKIRADKEAVAIFADNLKHLLLAAPLGAFTVIGIDPGLRTGCKCAVVDSTGKFIDTVTMYLSQSERAKESAKEQLLDFILQHRPRAIGIGNGTGGRETETFVRKLLSEKGLKDLIVVSVSEAGASVYSASDIAREEFPDLDLTIRGAISIGRRLQDPLAELVKVDPKSIGVGQYQHDVYQPMLQEKLSEVVETCVNHVGVELNTASAPLLSYVAGIGNTLAQRVVKYRENNGPFTSRNQVMSIPGFGPKTFEQSAGFLRVRESSNPLDSSAVHPERYGLVEMIAKDLGVGLNELVCNAALAQTINVKKYINENVGELTLKDIVAELKKPGRDPRATFEAPKFLEEVNSIEDLKLGMTLEGIVTNVTAFGAFVDIGVHQDGLVHKSALTDHYVEDPRTVVNVGQKIRVQVQEIDIERKRIALSCLIGQKTNNAESQHKPTTNEKKLNKPSQIKPARQGFNSSPFANL